MEELLSKHRKEQKDLQGKITQKKKSATKKTRKGVNDECERMQQELSEKHKTEIAHVNGDPVEGLEDLNLEDEQTDEEPNEDKPPQQQAPPTEPNPEPTVTPNGKKPNRQKARLARRAAEQEAASAAAAEEAKTQVNYRGNEQEVMDAVFKKLNLKEVEITPDGHCLYSAIAKQLDESGLGLRPDPSRIILQPSTQSRIDTVASPQHDGYRAVRAVTADFIAEHKEDFEAFMEEPIDSYTRKIKLTAEWGGQLELQAIARAYGVEINVVQSDGRMEKIESGDGDSLDEGEKDKRVIWLAYYKYSYSLGCHYNLLKTC
jgi:OTU domain-containing protein 6